MTIGCTLTTGFRFHSLGLVCLVAILAGAGCDSPNDPSAPKRNLHGFTRLHIAAQAVDMEVVSDLLLHGADPNVPDDSGVAPLHRAARDGHDELVAELVRYSADLDRKTTTGWTPLHLAIRAGDSEMVNLLLSYGASPRVALPDGMTPLIYAAEKDEALIADLLMAMGATTESADGIPYVDARDKQGNSALLIAVKKGNSDLAVSLLASGADANIENKKQETPLHVAIGQDDELVAGMLLESGASLFAAGPGGANAIAAARQRGNFSMMELLASYMPNANL